MSTKEGTSERGKHSGRLHKSSSTIPQSLILNPLGQMCFGIQNSLDLSEVIQCVHNIYIYITFPAGSMAVPWSQTH